MQAGDLVKEKTKTNRKPSLGILLYTCEDRNPREKPFPYFIHWFDNDEQEWTKEIFFEVVNNGNIERKNCL